MAKILFSASEIGEGSDNEDIIGWNGNRIWVIDGGTDCAETIRPRSEMSGSLWIASLLDTWLREYSTNIAILLAEFSRKIGEAVEPYRTDSSQVSPVCSVTVAERRGARVLIYSVGDVTAFLPQRGLLIENDSFSRNEKLGVKTDHETKHSSIVSRRRRYLDGEGGNWILGDNPRVRAHVLEVQSMAIGQEQVLLASDGFMRAIQPYKLYPDLRELLKVAQQNGVSVILRQIRDVERGLPGRGRESYKQSDDATVVYGLI